MLKFSIRGMLSSLSLKQILFLDLETVPEYEDWDQLPLKEKELWEQKTQFQRKEDVSAEDFYYQRAGILSEFGKIICISCGIITDQNKIRIKSFYGHQEEKILADFNYLLNSNYFSTQLLLCAHNGKEFDFPYLARRMIIHQIELPRVLQLHGKKPWEIPHLDTMELWKFGDYKHYTSLDLLAHVFNLPTPKADIDGSRVAEVYYKEKDVERIKDYCEKDVETLINVFLKMRYQNPLERE